MHFPLAVNRRNWLTSAPVNLPTGILPKQTAARALAAKSGGGAPGPWQSGSLFTNSRSMPVNNLTPGTNYSFQVRAIGGSTGYSGWCDAVSHMSL